MYVISIKCKSILTEGFEYPIKLLGYVYDFKEQIKYIGNNYFTIITVNNKNDNEINNLISKLSIEAIKHKIYFCTNQLSNKSCFVFVYEGIANEVIAKVKNLIKPDIRGCTDGFICKDITVQRLIIDEDIRISNLIK